MNNKKEIQNKLISEKRDLESDASFYECFILSGDNRYSQTPEEYREKQDFVKQINENANHADYKSKTENCLSCTKVLNCKSKC